MSTVDSYHTFKLSFLKVMVNAVYGHSIIIMLTIYKFELLSGHSFMKIKVRRIIIILVVLQHHQCIISPFAVC